MNETHGIDVSKHQGHIDWQRVKASGRVDFAILRAGLGRTAAQKDARFEENYAAATAAGIPVGAYWYSYAVTPEEARQEAQACLQVIAGKQFAYPIWFDLEEGAALKTGKANCSAMVRAFCDVLEAAGCWVGLYASRSVLTDLIEPAVCTRYAIWVAEWGSSLHYDGAVGIWQRSDSGSVPGVAGTVDLDTCFVDYPALIRAAGRNGFAPPETAPAAADAQPSPDPSAAEPPGASSEPVSPSEPEPPATPKPMSELVQEILRGEWGNGDERKRRLTAAGYKYSIVQAAVNAAIRKASGRIHTVAAGDTLTKIARTYGTTVSAILAANAGEYPAITANHICVGWRLKV